MDLDIVALKRFPRARFDPEHCSLAPGPGEKRPRSTNRVFQSV